MTNYLTPEVRALFDKFRELERKSKILHGQILPPEKHSRQVISKPLVDAASAYRLETFQLSFYTRIGEVKAQFKRADVWESRARPGQFFTVGFYDLVVNDYGRRIREITSFVYTYRDGDYHQVKQFPKRIENMR